MYHRVQFALCLLAFGLQGVNTAGAEEELGTPPSPGQRESEALVHLRDDLIETRRQFHDRLTDGPQIEPVLKSLRELIAQFDERIKQLEQQIEEHIRRYPDLRAAHESRTVPIEPGGTARPDKSIYNLFNPVPKELMREMSTDRPDKTESPYTVDAGRFQVETDLLTYSRAEEKGETGHTRSDAWALAPVNLKLGLLNNMDLQIVIDTYNLVDTEDTRNTRTRLRSALEFYDLVRTTGNPNGNLPERINSLLEARKLVLNRDLRARNTQRQSGFGDVSLRLKINVWGNDGGKTAFAVMPFIKFPTNQDDLGNNAVEGGVIFPLAVELPAGWGMGLMTEVDFLRNDSNNDYHASWINSITFSHNIVGNLGGYVEFFSEVSSEHGAPWVGTVDCGLTYGLTDNIQLDVGVNVGVTEAADDVNPFVGLSWRF